MWDDSQELESCAFKEASFTWTVRTYDHYSFAFATSDLCICIGGCIGFDGGGLFYSNL